MFRRGLEISHFCLHAEERREGGGGESQLPTFRLSARKSSDHFEKRKLGRVVSKLSLVDQLDILEEVEDDLNTEDEKVKTSKLEHQDSGISVLSLEVKQHRLGKICMQILQDCNHKRSINYGKVFIAPRSIGWFYEPLYMCLCHGDLKEIF